MAKDCSTEGKSSRHPELEWLLVVISTFISALILSELLLYISSITTGSLGILLTFHGFSLMIALAIVYVVRASRSTTELPGVIWKGVTAGAAPTLPPRALLSEVFEFTSNRFGTPDQFGVQIEENFALKIHLVWTYLLGSLIQVVLIFILGFTGGLDALTNMLAGDFSISLIVAIATLVHPVLGVVFLLLVLISGSPEGTTILLFTIGLPTLLFVVTMWNALAYFEYHQYRYYRRIEKTVTELTSSQFLIQYLPGVAYAAPILLLYFRIRIF